MHGDLARSCHAARRVSVWAAGFPPLGLNSHEHVCGSLLMGGIRIAAPTTVRGRDTRLTSGFQNQMFSDIDARSCGLCLSLDRWLSTLLNTSQLKLPKRRHTRPPRCPLPLTRCFTHCFTPRPLVLLTGLYTFHRGFALTAFARGGSLACFLAKLFAIVVIRPPDRRLGRLAALSSRYSCNV